MNAVHSELLQVRDRVQEIDVVGPPSSKQIEEIASLPPHTIALFQLVTDPRNQGAIGRWDILSLTAKRLPIYSAWPSLCLDRGCIGWAYPDYTKADLSRIELAIRVLSGERPEQIPIVHSTDLQVQGWCQPRGFCRELTEEALHNALKYSGVKHFQVEVTGTQEEVRLTVSDAGAGFDPQAAIAGRGLGILSMQERIHLVEGSLSMRSESGNGTTIIATVPFATRDVQPTAEAVRSA